MVRGEAKMREGIIPPVQKSLSTSGLEDTGSVSYESGTGLLFVVILVALAAIGLSLVAFAH
jgi:hypothetical protein